MNGGAVSVAGLGAGEPALVFLSGLGDPANWWFTVPTRQEGQPHWNGGPHENGLGLATLLGASGRVIAYDRAGIGSSPAPDHDRTLQEIHAELTDVLNASRLSRPPVLVGHSLGGLIAYTYARRHPQALAGLVLLDPTPLPTSPKPHGASPERLALTHFGPEEVAPNVLGSLPLLIVAPGTVAAGLEDSEQERLNARFLLRRLKHQELLATSAGSTGVWTVGSGHYIHLDDPENLAADMTEFKRQL
jgi:pimeloyl-ACP methyl ester carboxylesterase